MRTLNKRPTGFNWSQYRQALTLFLIIICGSMALFVVAYWQYLGGNG